jgi:hypothetical protein
MKKIFSYIGLIALAISSFILTEKTTIVIKETDEIMIQIKENKQKYEQAPIQAEETEKTITPGLNGRKVNIKKTYQEMKKIGIYNEQYYIYDQIKPNKSIKNKYDKYIENGNKQKKMISILIKTDNEEQIKKIMNMTEQERIKVTFLIDNKKTKTNKPFTQEQLKNNRIIYLNNLKKNKYCYTEKENEQLLSKCTKLKKHTIKPHVIKNNLLKETKKELRNGIIITLKVNENTKKELELTINYIKSKGYKIADLEEIISEKNTN